MIYLPPRQSKNFSLTPVFLMALMLGCCFCDNLVFHRLSAQLMAPDLELAPIDELEADPEIPDLKAVLDIAWGTEIVNHQQMEAYFQALTAAAPQRCQWIKYGESYEGRSLNYMVITSAENLKRIDELRQQNLMLADPRLLTESDANELLQKLPAVVWLGYSVHGNEICPTEAAMLTAYHLLADQRETTQEQLKNLIVVIDPLQNPDGRERFVNVFRETRGRFVQSFPLANEHTERWPGGRSNHYWFDMNRDWFLQSQQETRAKVAAYLKWQPQLFIDAHEMGRNSTFFFPPPAEPKNPFLLPAQNNLSKRLGQHHAQWFDNYQFPYTTREMFDAFYPGYGSEWPSLQGGLGILWEQASPRGMLIDRDDETQLSYAQGVRNLYISALATLEFSANHHSDLLETFYNNRQRNIRLGTEGEISDFFLIANDRPQRAHRLVEVLQRNGIEVRRLNQAISVESSSSHDRATQMRTVPKGSYHVSVAQPVGGLIRALLDREVSMDRKFLDRQLERNRLRLRDEIYDVTAWSLPLAFDVTCYAARQAPLVDSELIENVSNQDVTTMEERNQDEPPRAKIAYIIPGTDGAMELLAGLVRDGFRVHVCDETFKLSGREFDRGTLIIRVAENDESIHETIRQRADSLEVEVIATDTAFVDEGAHFGGPQVYWVKPPKILLVVNQPTSSSSGHIWFLFDEQLKYPITRVNGQEFSMVDLDKFNTIILPDGNYSSNFGFGESMAKKLNDWVAKGGTLITMAGATRWATGENVGLLKNRLVTRKVESEAKDDDEKEKPTRVSPDRIPGSFFKTSVFQKHWLTFHYRPELHVFFSGNIILTPTKETEGRSIVSFVAEEQLLTSGFCWPESLKLLEQTPMVVYRSIGRGHVVAFNNDPNYRAMYPGIQRMFINAAMFGAGH